MTNMYFFAFIWVFNAIFTYGLNYEDEVNQDPEIIESRKNAISWLFSKQNEEGGWGTKDNPETHRILTTLSLSNSNYTQHSLSHHQGLTKLSYELTSLLTCDTISSGQLALYINSILATCYKSYDFYEIIRRMKHKPKVSNYERGLVSLSICIAGYRVPKEDIQHYLKMLKNQTSNIDKDTKAIIVMALICVKRSHSYYNFLEPYIQYQLHLFKTLQNGNDSSFGNIYTSALIVQSLIAYDDGKDDWSFRNSLQYFLSQQKEDGSFGDLLATYFVLPILNGHSLLHIKNILCEDSDEKYEEFETNKQNTSINVRYSLSDRNISKLITVPENSTFLDVMKIAQASDCKYSFKGIEHSLGYFIQEIGGNSYCYGILYKIDEMGNLFPISNDCV
ncbi:uncharacterized protein [Centruroides vittatus]|uniref:uncharacterized protein isoform X2 n=1 Tax=Centruroides vittatus TaxID=120091 RepID=UPI003510058E